MPVSPYLFFNGTCAEAMRFYEKTLGGRLEALMTYGESPEACPETFARDQIMHAALKLDDGSVIMASDAQIGAPEPISGVAIATGYPSLERTKAVFDALSEAGTVVMPWGKTFWSEGFGMVTDRYGVHWMLGVEA